MTKFCYHKLASLGIVDSDFGQLEKPDLNLKPALPTAGNVSEYLVSEIKQVLPTASLDLAGAS